MPLARSVPADYPIYGLQARGLAAKSPLPRSVGKDGGSEYIEQIRAVAPVEPVLPAGLGRCGIAAHEIAVQLQAGGGQVAALVIMDAYPLGRGSKLAASRGHRIGCCSGAERKRLRTLTRRTAMTVTTWPL